ncbi:hypothetical protein CGMCC3_g14602 [Colletotrichum fructicola]|nr:uncharacterized protein CGMCC3_g14602 [Colletotrichum fructicola]KAE9569238.1 hypothetical protein CGMCC3_g14602 [Colletotrichum fructicola]
MSAKTNSFCTRRSLSKCVYNNTGPKDHSISRDRDGNKNDNGRSSSATPQKPSSPMSNASIGRHDRQPSESVVSSNAIGDADMLANVGHGSIFDVVPHLGQPVINESELFQGPLLDASTMNIPELDFFLKCGLPDKQASPVAAGPSLGPQFDLASTVTWANMGLDMSSTTQNEFTGGTSPMKTVRYMSSSSSQSSLMPDRDSSSSSECSMATNTASFCCEGLRLLLRVFAGQEKEEHVIILPGYETVRPVMDMFAKLERFSQQRQHDRRAAILRRASITPLTASGVRDMIPSKVRCDVLVEAYSRTFESVMRILDVPVFLREYNDFWEKPAAKLTTKDEPFACKLLLVVALASCVCLGVGSPTEGESAQQEVSAGWIIQVKQWFEQKMLTGAQSQMDMAQILCLLALTRNIQHHPGASASSALCLGYYDPTHIGIRMGLHRESPARGIAPADPRTTELRRRLWATMLELSLQICLDEGLPPPLAPDAYNCEPPSSLADEGIGRSSSQSDSTRSIVLIKLSGTQRLRLRILQLLNNPGADYTFEESHQLAGELSAACNSDLNTLHSMQSKQPQLSDFQVKTLDTLTRPFVLALHGRFATRACSTPAFYFSRQMRMETAHSNQIISLRLKRLYLRRI